MPGIVLGKLHAAAFLFAVKGSELVRAAALLAEAQQRPIPVAVLRRLDVGIADMAALMISRQRRQVPGTAGRLAARRAVFLLPCRHCRQ